MATIDYWAEAPTNREQIALFAPTLDSVIADDDPVRLFDEVLAGVDWSEWEAEYHGRIGQPPIHPRYVAAAILYGLYRRIRSSRQLEQAAHYRLDFIWLLHDRRIDHTTIAKFRIKFRQPLKGLFRQIGRIAMNLGLIRLCEVAFDGTRVKANNSRHATRTAKTLEEKLAVLDELFEQMMAELDSNDASQKTLGGQDDSPVQLCILEGNIPHRVTASDAGRPGVEGAVMLSLARRTLRHQEWSCRDRSGGSVNLISGSSNFPRPMIPAPRSKCLTDNELG